MTIQRATAILAIFSLFVGCTQELASEGDHDIGFADTGSADLDSGDTSSSDSGSEDTSSGDTSSSDSGSSDASFDQQDTELPDVDGGEVDVEEDEPAPPPPTFEAHFNEPVDGGNDNALEDVIIDLLAKAEPGSLVRGAFYTWSRTRVAHAFVDAYEAGVDVELVVGNTNQSSDGSEYAAIGILRDGLGDRLTICREGESSGGCIGDGIQHNKFALFSALEDGSEDVILQSSANFTNPQRRAFNNTLVIRGDHTLYQAHLDYWHDLRDQQQNLDYYRSTVGDHRTKVYLFPRASGDTIVNVLNNVTCDGDSHIHVGMARFTNPRSAIADALVARLSEGCNVSVLVRESTTSTGIIDTLNISGLDLAIFPDGADHGVHSKYLLIDAPYGSNATRQKLVWTGSHNYTGPALRNHDESLLKIRNDGVYEAFLDNWEMMRGRL